jgi:DtxR family Mn-dependent transcriptional regulator
MVSVERVEEYLEAIYDIQKMEKRVAKTNDLARKLNVKPSSVTEMLLKLSEKGYVEYQPYYGVVLTEKGKEVAKRIKRYYRIFETFFRDFLKIDTEEAHRLSCELEHHVTDEVVEKICEVIATNCEICDECGYKIVRLSEAEPGSYEVIASPVSVSSVGILPGKTLKVKESGFIEVGREDVRLSPKISSKIILEKVRK